MDGVSTIMSLISCIVVLIALIFLLLILVAGLTTSFQNMKDSNAIVDKIAYAILSLMTVYTIYRGIGITWDMIQCVLKLFA